MSETREYGRDAELPRGQKKEGIFYGNSRLEVDIEDCKDSTEPESSASRRGQPFLLCTISSWANPQSGWGTKDIPVAKRKWKQNK